MLKVTNIQKSFNGNQVLKGIDFDINKGEVVAILGPSGSGKTTFLNMLSNFIPKDERIITIEDAAEAIGQTAYGTPCGAFGDISCFSFYPNKHVTTGEGGMVLCNDDALAARCRSLRNLSFVPERRVVPRGVGIPCERGAGFGGCPACSLVVRNGLRRK